ncbi:hypothetical protein [Neobacillus notoginsengisoli]|uniref:hypothetical protein n=1 Tax=Neobacillus notoginsengisoli TaxID=1578198 RepID=UPI001F02FBF6|nr:hypothetical protein [Neobacillus notoginsengisoli]
MPLSYLSMFPAGSKPEDWMEQPPLMAKLIDQLEEQVVFIEQACKGHLDEPLKTFLGMKTIGDFVIFNQDAILL